VDADPVSHGWKGSEAMVIQPGVGPEVELGVDGPVACHWRRSLQAQDLRPARTCWRTLTASCRLALGPHFHSRGHGPRSAVSARCFRWAETEAEEAEETGLVDAMTTGAD